MTPTTQKLVESLAKLHNKEAEQRTLLTGEILTYKVGDTIVIGNEVITPTKGMYRLSSNTLNENKKDIGFHYFSYLQSAMTYSVAQQRGWLGICLEVADYDKRMANAESDIVVFTSKAKKVKKVDPEKYGIYMARLASAKNRFITSQSKLKVLAKKAKYRMK